MNASTKTCPDCGKEMHRRWAGSFFMYLSTTSFCSWNWVCLCGHMEQGGVEKGLLLEEMTQLLEVTSR